MTGRPLKALGWTVFGGAVCLLSLGGLTRSHNWGDDFATYILQARSIVQGNPSQFVEANRFTIETSTYVIGPIAAPWGAPVLLAVPYALFGLDIVALKSVNVVCYWLFLLVLWWGFRRHHSGFWLFVLVALFALNPSFHSTFMNRILSDIPFLLFSTLSIILIGRVVIDRARLVAPVVDHVLLGLAMAAAFFVRGNGVLLVATLATTHAIQAIRNRRAAPSAVGAVPYLVVAVAVVVWKALLPEGGYVPPSTPVSIRGVWRNLHYYLDLPADFFAGAPLARVVYGATIPLALVGMYDRMAVAYPMIIYALLTGLLYVVWPETSGLRYLFPVLPLFMSFVVAALETRHVGVPRWRRGLWTIVRAGPAIVVLLCFASASGAAVARNLAGRNPEEPGPYLATAQQLFAFVSRETDPHAVIVFFKPRALRLFTDRSSVAIGRADRLDVGDHVCLYLRQEHPNQVPREVVSRLQESGRLIPVYRNADFECYRIWKEALAFDRPAAHHSRTWLSEEVVRSGS
jgi:hypothetical protein